MANKIVVKSNKKVRKIIVKRNTTVETGGEQPYDVEYGGEAFQQ